MPQTSQASRKALAAPTMADFQGAMRRPARQIASRIGGREATRADSNTLPATGL